MKGTSRPHFLSIIECTLASGCSNTRNITLDSKTEHFTTGKLLLFLPEKDILIKICQETQTVE